MANDFYQKINQWFEAIKTHEITDMVEWVEQAKAYIVAAESIPDEKIKQFIDNLKYDLTELYQQNQAEFQHSVYLELMNESLWQNLAEMTDKSQVEWSELMEDFQHDGIYHSGDYIGFGELECTHCHHQHIVSHFSQVNECLKCGGKEFVRHGLMP